MEEKKNSKPYLGHVLIIDDEENMCKILAKLLKLEGFRTDFFTNPLDAIENLNNINPDVIVTDIKMPQMTGLKLLEKIKEINPSIIVIMMTAYGTIETAIEAIRLGAFHYITKPFNTDELVLIINKSLEHKKLKEENISLSEQISHQMLSPLIIGEDPSVIEINKLIEKIANTDSSVLITGKSGTGKELVAKSIHTSSLRNIHRFVAINCASIPENLIESELFGYEKGAFTGADKRKIGLIELAHKGTLFLDEIGDLPLSLQSKILRVLQEREIQRVGGLDSIKVDIRLIAATNIDLERAIETKEFRQDLFYRLNVITIKIPPLRERKQDIKLLAEYFVKKCGVNIGKPNIKISSDALKILSEYHWPGNVRELENIIERMMVLTDKNIITQQDIPLDIIQQKSPLDKKFVGDDDYKTTKYSFEKEYFTNLLKKTNGNVTEAANIAGISRRHFYEKMEKLDLNQ